MVCNVTLDLIRNKIRSGGNISFDVHKAALLNLHDSKQTLLDGAHSLFIH